MIYDFIYDLGGAESRCFIIIPVHDTTNKMTYVPSEGPDQQRYLSSLVRVFTVDLKTLRILSYLISAQQTRTRSYSLIEHGTGRGVPNETSLCVYFKDSNGR